MKSTSNETQPDRATVMSFNAWLMKNLWRGDSIGDLARTARKDATWPRRRKHLEDFTAYLLNINRTSRIWNPTRVYSEAPCALHRAWTEYNHFNYGHSSSNDEHCPACKSPLPVELTEAMCPSHVGRNLLANPR